MPNTKNDGRGEVKNPETDGRLKENQTSSSRSESSSKSGSGRSGGSGSSSTSGKSR